MTPPDSGVAPCEAPGSPNPQASSVQAEVGYVHRPDVPAFAYMYEPEPGVPRENYQADLRRVRITDARTLADCPGLHIHGFGLWDAPTGADFGDGNSIRATYYPECLELALSATGASHGYVFDHLVRRREPGRPQLAFGRHGDGRSPAAVGRVHNDYSEASGLRRLRLVLGESGTPAVSRFAIVNIWRSIGGPVVDTPLAVCDARTVSAADTVLTTIKYQDRTGEIYLFEHAERHRWYYYPRMDRHEALMFKQYDSQLSGIARMTPHVAFDLPDVPADAPLRQSIEVRCLVVF